MWLLLIGPGFSAGCNLCQSKRHKNQVWIHGESIPSLRSAGRGPLPNVGETWFKEESKMHIPGLQPQAQLLGGPACRYPDTVLSSPCQIVGNGGNILPVGEVGSIAICVRPSWPFCFSNCYLVSGGEWPFHSHCCVLSIVFCTLINTYFLNPCNTYMRWVGLLLIRCYYDKEVR